MGRCIESTLIRSVLRPPRGGQENSCRSMLQRGHPVGVDEMGLTETAKRAFLDALSWLGNRYGEQVFYVERDVVYAVQTRLNELSRHGTRHFACTTTTPLWPGARRGLSADLVLLGPSQGDRSRGGVQVRAVPSPPRCAQEQVACDCVGGHRQRHHACTGVDGNVHVGYAVVIDEGGYLARRDLAVYADRQRWSGQPNHNHPIDALIFRYPGERLSHLREACPRRRVASGVAGVRPDPV